MVNTTVTAKNFQASKIKNDSDNDGPDLQPVAVALNIAKLPNWNINISPGSWTRVITNILGNALKYTKTGVITVDLQFKPSDQAHKSLVSLVVEDTGQGIGSEYLRNHLYTPFMQENTHAVGTGLGLSIVRQIVQDFGGRINFQSELGRGTKVIVYFHAEFDDEAEMDISIPRRPDGSKLRIAFLRSTGKSDSDAVEKAVKSVASKTCVSWLDCHSEILGPNDGAGHFDVCILSESEYIDWQEKRKSFKNQPPMVVLASVSSSAARTNTAKNVIIVNQP